MLKAEGYSVIVEPGKRDLEHDTFTCAHCNAITFTAPGLGKPLQVAIIDWKGGVRMQDAGFCRTCYRHICPRCEAIKECTPLMKKIEEEEAAAQKLILPSW